MTDKNSSEVAKATRWSFLTQLTAKVIPPLTSMILARLLAPEVFGIITTITMVTSFAETFSEAGFQKYIISTNYTDDTELEHDEDIAFWTHLVISLFAHAAVPAAGKSGRGNGAGRFLLPACDKRTDEHTDGGLLPNLQLCKAVLGTADLIARKPDRYDPSGAAWL